jgi:GWxTD domain-containing protein
VASVITDQRRAVEQLLDSALRLDPLHADAERLRLRRALVDNDWDAFATLAGRWARLDPAGVAPRLAVLAAQVHDTAYRAAGQTLVAIDSLIPDSLRATYERFEVISRNVDLTRAEEVWALSDPLYLTPENERRVQLYARLALADIMFTDPTEGIAGRDTQPGKLLLRYGWPTHIWEVERDQSKETDPVTMRILLGEIAAPLPQTQVKAGGRWTFFNYDLDVPSFVFERNLS